MNLVALPAADNGDDESGAAGAVPGESPGETGFEGAGSGLFPVVGIGGSAGSLEALQKFFMLVPSPSDAAYVVVTHLSPDHESHMAEILQRDSLLPLMQVTETVRLVPGTVYVIPPGKLFAMKGGVLKIVDMPERTGRHVTVDLFFRALAETHAGNAVAIVLSGADSDGSIGIKRIKERGGLTIAQDPSQAEHPGMPKTAISTGMIDWILPVEEMPGRLGQYWENGRKLLLPPEEETPPPRGCRGGRERGLARQDTRLPQAPDGA